MALPHADPQFPDLKEGIRTIMQKAFKLFLLCDCKVCMLVEHQQDTFVFNSEDFQWPPPDRELEVYCPNVNRLSGSQEIYSRITEDERKDLIQLLICVNALAAGIRKEQGIAGRLTAQSNAVDQANEVAETVLDRSSETSDSEDEAACIKTMQGLQDNTKNYS